MVGAPDDIDPEILNTWAHELLAAWSDYNWSYLNGVLRPPQIRLTAGGSVTLGTWTRDSRLISIAIDHVWNDSWHDVLATLRHEMAHQLADEAFGGDEEPPHGPAFRRAAELMRVSPRAAAAVETTDADATARERLLTRIQKLLSLGTSPNRNEAEVALQKARELLVKHNVDAVEQRRDRRFATRTLGPLKGRHQAWEYALGGLLTEFFFVEALWTHGFDARRCKRGSALQVFGTDANLAMAEYVHGYLSGLLESLWRDYKRSKGLTRDRDRQRYYHGLMRGFAEKLRAQDRQLRQEAGLVLRADPELERYYRYHNPHVRTIRRGASAGGEAYADGKRDGRAITLRRPLADGGGAFGGYLEG